jgi:hypothetical protein
MTTEPYTPRTDNQAVRYYDDASGNKIEYIPSPFARQLERELVKLTKQRNNLIDTLKYIAYSGLSARHLVDIALETLKETNNKQHE